MFPSSLNPVGRHSPTGCSPIDARGDGYFYGIELVKDKATRLTFDDESERLLRGFLSSALFEVVLVPRTEWATGRRAGRVPIRVG